MEISATIVMRNVKKNNWKKLKQVRKELVNKFTFLGLYKDTQEMWEDVAYYIECIYKKEEIETVKDLKKCFL